MMTATIPAMQRNISRMGISGGTEALYFFYADMQPHILNPGAMMSADPVVSIMFGFQNEPTILKNQ